MLVNLMKKESTYTDKRTGEQKKATRFYLQCGTQLVPVTVTYFENTETGTDPQYSARKAILKAFSDDMPEKEGNAHG